MGGQLVSADVHGQRAQRAERSDGASWSGPAAVLEFPRSWQPGWIWEDAENVPPVPPLCLDGVVVALSLLIVDLLPREVGTSVGRQRGRRAGR